MWTTIDSLKRFEEAMETIAERVLRVSRALEKQGIPHEVIGGLAVAAWVFKADPDAVRTTMDVDLVVRRHDLEKIKGALEGIGFQFRHPLGIPMFVDEHKPKVKGGVHLLFENEKVRSDYLHPVPPLVENPPRADQGYRIAPLDSLIRMKLTSYRRKDQVHLDDLLSVGLITPEIEAALPTDLRARLQFLKDTPQE